MGAPHSAGWWLRCVVGPTGRRVRLEFEKGTEVFSGRKTWCRRGESNPHESHPRAISRIRSNVCKRTSEIREKIASRAIDSGGTQVSPAPKLQSTQAPKNPKAISRHYLTMVDCKLTTHSFGSRKVRNMSREKELNWPGLLFTFAMMSILFWIGLISLLW